MMEGQLFKLIGLYSIYYILAPGVLVFAFRKVKHKSDFIRVSAMFGEKEKNRSDILENENTKLKKLQVLLVIIILISVPLLNLTFHGVRDISMHRTRDFTEPRTVFPAHIDRVEAKIGPSFDKESVLERMEEEGEDVWHMDDIRGNIDMDKLTRLPGRITVYKLRSTLDDPERIIINYAYLSIIPATRSVEFMVLEEKAFLEADQMVVYPMPPSMAAPSGS